MPRKRVATTATAIPSRKRSRRSTTAAVDASRADRDGDVTGYDDGLDLDQKHRIDQQRKRLRPSAINSVTGETNAQVVAAIEAAWMSTTPRLSAQALAAEVVALRLIDKHGDVKPLAQWTFEQRSAAVKLWRSQAPMELVLDPADYDGDEAACNYDLHLLSTFQCKLTAEAKVNADMSLQFQG